jgi:adenylylsulfate kinase
MGQQNGWCVWVTGLPGSGKSLISRTLLEKLREIGVHAQIISSDMLRKVITPNPTYAEEERDIVYATIVFVAKLLTQNGVNVVIDATANRRRYRENARKEITSFIEAYIRCPLGKCIEREAERGKTFHAPENIYKKALTGKSTTVPGMGTPYEEPFQPDVIIDSDKLDPNQCAQKIFEVIKKTVI